MAITKTDFMRGMQCPKMLWLDKHKPGLKVIPPEIQEKLDAGNDFGDFRLACVVVGDPARLDGKRQAQFRLAFDGLSVHVPMFKRKQFGAVEADGVNVG